MHRSDGHWEDPHGYRKIKQKHAQEIHLRLYEFLGEDDGQPDPGEYRSVTRTGCDILYRSIFY